MALEDRRVVNAVLYGDDGTPVAVDGSGYVMTAGGGSGSSGALQVREGYLTSTSTSTSVVRSSLWADPGDGAQRGVKSSSNSDRPPNGNGLRTVRVTYYRGDGSGPFTEDVTLDGTSAVATQETNMRFVESIEALTVGSNGAAVGNVDVTAMTNGNGTVLARVNAGETRTYYAHHWVPSGTTMNLTSVYMAARATSGSGSTGRIMTRQQATLTADSAVVDVTFGARCAPGEGTVTVPYEPPLQISGPRMFNLWVRADTNTGTEWFVGFSFYDS